MKNFIYTGILLASLVFSLRPHKAQAQDNQFSQFYAAPLFINPAFTGALGYACDDPKSRWRGVANYRRQWSYFDTYAVSVDYLDPARSRDKGLGFGGQIIRDIAKNGFTNTSVAGSAAYISSLNNDWGFNAGLQLGYTMRGFAGGSLTYPDQFNDYGFTNTTTPDNQQSYTSKGFVEAAAGAVLYNRNFWIGFAGHHLNRPNQALAEEGSDRISRRFSVHTGYKISFNDQPKSMTRRLDEHSLTPVFQFRHQGSFNQVDLGAYYTKEPLTLGLTYRGLPIKKGEDNKLANEALVGVIGLKTMGFRIGYSFDYTLSGLNKSSYKNAHEISLAYQFVSDKCQRRLMRKIACPSF